MEILLSTLIMLLILGACLYQRTSLFTSLAALTFTMLALFTVWACWLFRLGALFGGRRRALSAIRSPIVDQW